MHDVIECAIVIVSKLKPSSTNNIHHFIEADSFSAVFLEVNVMLISCMFQICQTIREQLLFVRFIYHKMPMIDVVGVGLFLDPVVKHFDV